MAALAVTAVLATACGGSSRVKTACELVSKSAVSTQAVKLVESSAVALSATSEETPGLSVCRYHGGDLSVRVSIDTNQNAPRRFWYRLTEQWEFYAGNESRKPVLVSGVGDDQSAFGGAGAYWVASNLQLIALSSERLVVVTLGAGDVPAARARAAAIALARLVTRAGGAKQQAPRKDATPATRLEVFAPLTGVLVRALSVTVRGAVAPADARVQVDGRTVHKRPGGFFSERVTLDRGSNAIQVTARRDGQTIGDQRLEVRRGASPSEAAAALVRRADGRLPDLRTQRLDVTLAVLRALGLRHRESTIGPGRVVPARWTVCATKPAASSRVRAGRSVMLFVAPGRLDKPSTTDCVSD